MLTNLDKLDSKINEIINSIDIASASSLLKEFSHLSPEEKKSLGSKLTEFLLKLRIVNFPNLANEEAADIVRNHLMLFFKLDIPFEQRLVARYSFQGTTEKNIQRKIIKSAILENKELIGNVTIGDWLKKFDQYCETSNYEADQNIINFFTIGMGVNNLNQTERYVLKSIIHTYDTLIATELMDIFDAVAMFQSIEKKYPNSDIPIDPSLFSDSFTKASIEQIQAPMFSIETQPNPTYSSPQNSKKIILEDTLRSFPQIEDQLITSRQIKISGTSQPVRPSINNWLSDYTYNLGYGSHNSIVRNNYLFQNSNAKVLGTSERERLSYILKAYDEKTPVMVDMARKQIVFPAATTNSASHQTVPPSQPARMDMNTQPHVENSSSARVQNRLSEISNQPPLSKSAGAQNNVYNDVSRNIQKNYDYYQMPQKAPTKDSGQATSFGSHTNQNFSTPANRQSFGSDTANHLGSPAFKPEVHPVSPVNNLTFSSTQKLPFEREKEENPHFSTPAPNPAPPKITSQPVPPKPIEQEKPYEPQPLRINPATYDDEEQDELPRNVVNLRK